MLNTFQDSPRFKSGFKNGAVDDEWQRAYFRDFFETPYRNEANEHRWKNIAEAHLFHIYYFL